MTSSLAFPYELGELIARGQRGEVYLAYHRGLERVEAVKVLVGGLDKDDQFVARLRREARAASLLTHPHIVSVYGFGLLEDGRYYLAMEYLGGTPLDRYLKGSGGLDEPLTLRFLYQLASALSHAHDQSVVHRDIKPAHLMVVQHESTAPNIKVLDFGLAKIMAPFSGSPKRISTLGAIFGTPGYMAPERANGADTVPSSDIYSFGCVAYHLITGRAPFVGGVMTVLEAHHREMPRPPSQRAQVSPELESIVMCCLAKDPRARYQHGTALLEALAGVRGFLSESTRKTTRASTGREPKGELALARTENLSREDIGRAQTEEVSSQDIALPTSKPGPSFLHARTAVDAQNAPSGHATEAPGRGPKGGMDKPAHATTAHRERFPEVSTAVDAHGALFGHSSVLLDLAQAEASYRYQLMHLSEGLAKAGYQSAVLGAAMVPVRSTAQNLAQLDETLSRLNDTVDALFQDFRRKEAHIRFELGEIRFRMTQTADAEERRAADIRINDLTQEVVAAEDAHERQLQTLFDREIGLAAARDSLEEDQRRNCAKLADLIDDNACASIGGDEISSRWQAYQTARYELQQVRPG